MNNKVLYYLLGIVIVLIGGVFLYKNHSSFVSDGLQTEEIKGLYSIDELLKLSRDIECKFDKSEGEAKISGKLLISESRVRGDFDINTGVSGVLPEKFKSYFLMRDGLVYSWTSILKKGLISKISTTSSTEGSIVGLYDKVQYDCKSSNSKKMMDAFNVPSDIDFTSL